MLQENTRVRSKIPSAFDPLMGPHIGKVDDALDPGLCKLTWTSINIGEFVENVYKELGELELLLIRANDLVEFRINTVLQVGNIYCNNSEILPSP